MSYFLPMHRVILVRELDFFGILFFGANSVRAHGVKLFRAKSHLLTTPSL
jgi:hypothetical protein